MSKLSSSDEKPAANEEKPDKPTEEPMESQSNRRAFRESSKSNNSTNSKSKKPEIEEKIRIFLLEVVLDELQLSYCTEYMNRCNKGPDCVSFRFLKHEPLTICKNKAVIKECREKKTGASSLFPLNPKDQEVARKEFIIDFELFRDTPDGTITLGYASLSITNLMKCVSAMCDTNEYKKAVEKEEIKQKPRSLPKPTPEVFTESVHQNVILIASPGDTCEEAAVMSVYVRLTCFGPVMMTDCKMNSVGKDTVPNYVTCPAGCTPRKNKL